MAFLIFDLQCAIFRGQEHEREVNKNQIGKGSGTGWRPPPPRGEVSSG